MKKNSLFILLGLMFMSCLDLDDFEPNASSFNKSYGNNLDAQLVGVLATKDNGFLLYGTMDKSIQSAPYTTGDVATLIKTDAMGHEMWRKSYGIENVSFENNPYLAPSTWEVSELYFGNIIELQNGNYFAAVEMRLPALLDYYAPGYIVFSETGAILEYNTFMDNIEDPGYLANEIVVRYRPSVYKIPGSSDIIITFVNSSLWLAPSFVEPSNNFYSLYRLRENDYQNPAWVMDNMVHLPDAWHSQSLAFDPDGTIVVVGRERANDEGQCFRVTMSKINVETGAVIIENVLTPADELHLPSAVIPYGDGYAILELTNNQPTQNAPCLWQPLNTSHVRRIGGVRLASTDLTTDTLIYSTLPEIAWADKFLLLETHDKELVFGFPSVGQGQAGSYIVKIDAAGQVIWEYRDPVGPVRRGLFQTPDGGIVFGGTTSFGGANKWSLTKLTKDGEL